ncbi:MAG: hypothetical protein HYR51_01220 [Candidatus Rokubacteria bacterium]|nr:hypothetical protein [Candidatus Rokubacteria bacterium]
MKRLTVLTMLLALAGVAVAGALVLVPTTDARDAEPVAAAAVAGGSGSSGPVQVRTPQDMRAFEAAYGAQAGDGAKPFMPTMDPADYAAAKAAASAGGGSAAPDAAAPGALAPPTLKFIQFNGIFQNDVGAGGSSWPPDTHGAVGHTQYVQVVNRGVRVWSKGTTTTQPTVLRNVTLSALFGNTESIFDPRVVYDPIYKRWVIVATRRTLGSTDTIRRFWLAVSDTSSATGSFAIYQISFSINPVANGDWCDYPQLGFDRDALLITCNFFTPTSFKTTGALAIPKALAYNRQGFSFPIFTGLAGTLAPPIVLDGSGLTYFIAAGIGGSSIFKHTMTNSSRTNVAMSSAAAVPVGVLRTTPPDATQPSTTRLIDTLDGRFVNASTQLGTTVWNIHSVNAGGRAGLRWYRINAATNTLIQSGALSSASLHYFNASIAANSSHNVVVTYSASGSTLRPSVIYTGKLSGEAAMAAGTNNFQSPAVLLNNLASGSTTVNRWGDYSAVTVDPTNSSLFWIVNETVVNTSTWGSRIVRVGFP